MVVQPLGCGQDPLPLRFRDGAPVAKDTGNHHRGKPGGSGDIAHGHLALVVVSHYTVSIALHVAMSTFLGPPDGARFRFHHCPGCLDVTCPEHRPTDYWGARSPVDSTDSARLGSASWSEPCSGLSLRRW